MESAISRSRLRFKRSRDFAEAIVQALPDPLVVLDAELRIKSVNHAFCSTFKLSAIKIVNRPIYVLNDVHWKFKRLRPLIKELLAQNSSTPHLEVNSYFTGRAHKTMLLNARRIPAYGTSKALILLTLQDISERKQIQHTLEKLIDTFKQDSLTDPLTGLYNRRGFLTLGAQFLKIGRRMGKEIFVLFADVDGLKAINDQRGHAEGDKVLVKVSTILKKTFRQSDIMSRIGGDEFAIVTIEHLPGSIATLVTRLKRNSVQANNDTPVSFSVGFAHSKSTDISSIEELVAKADAAMYIEKKHKSHAIEVRHEGGIDDIERQDRKRLDGSSRRN